MINTSEAYNYNAQGVRLTKHVQNGGGMYKYYFDGVNLLFTKKNGVNYNRYLYDGDSVYCGINTNDAAYWYHTDVRNSVTNVLKGDTTTSSSPYLVRSFTYNAYGDTDRQGGIHAEPDVDDIAYTGACYDKETELYYLMSRYYDPMIAQFISEDSYRGDGEHYWNLYAYCSGDPVNNSDRTGKFSIKEERKKADKRVKSWGPKKAYTQFWKTIIKHYEGNFPVAMFLLKRSLSGRTDTLIITSKQYKWIYDKMTNNSNFLNMLYGNRISFKSNLTTKVVAKQKLTYTLTNSVDMFMSFHNTTVKALNISKIKQTPYYTTNLFSGEIYDKYDFDNDTLLNAVSGGLNNYAASDQDAGILSEYSIRCRFKITKTYYVYPNTL